jgi:predicted CopG family antitoxin
MAELKTKETTASVSDFIDKIADPQRREDCRTVADIMRDVTGEEPKMWGSSIVGFGRYHYKYESGREGDWMITGFSPRKGDLTLYIMGGFDSYSDLLKDLGKYKTGKSCLYIRKLADIDVEVLRKLVKKSVKLMASQRIKS